MSRMGSFIDTLASGGYFDPGTKLGILIADDGTGRHQRLVDNVWKPRLAALGIPVVSTFTVSEPQDLGSSLGNTSAQQQSAVLRFKAAGIDHVLLTPSGGALSTFGPAAESQRYRPRYAMTSDDTPAGAATLVPKAQLTNSVAVGWLPVGDTGAQAAIPKNAATDRCLAIYKGQSPGFNVMQYCDAMFFLAAAYGAGGQATATALQTGAERLGRSYTSTNSFGPSVFGPKRYDGASQVRLATFDAAKGAYLYTGPLRPAP
jgi:ABC-type branched-subunit amino acid transport system substrate-binding protein